MSGFFCVFYQNPVELSMALCYTFTKVKGRKQNESFLYIEHFCILPKTLMLEIDPPKDDISKRRKGFYERSGFTEKSRESFSGCV